MDEMYEEGSGSNESNFFAFSFHLICLETEDLPNVLLSNSETTAPEACLRA